MAKYFSINDFTASRVANEKGIDNTPPISVKVSLAALINNLMDPIREKWGSEIFITSGFRSPVLNKAVGGAINSQHTKGEAADITTGSKNGNKKLFNMIANGQFVFDQLIDEKNYSWIHISYKSKNNRMQILHL